MYVSTCVLGSDSDEVVRCCSHRWSDTGVLRTTHHCTTLPTVGSSEVVSWGSPETQTRGWVDGWTDRR